MSHVRPQSSLTGVARIVPSAGQFEYLKFLLTSKKGSYNDSHAPTQSLVKSASYAERSGQQSLDQENAGKAAAKLKAPCVESGTTAFATAASIPCEWFGHMAHDLHKKEVPCSATERRFESQLRDTIDLPAENKVTCPLRCKHY